MRIGIDARFLTHPQRGGFKSYTENLIAALADVDKGNEYYLYVDREPLDGDLIPNRSKFKYSVVSGTRPLIGVPFREQISLPRFAAKDKIELFHSPCLTAPLKMACPLVVTVHDMIWASPDNFTSKGSLSPKRRLMDWYNYFVPKQAIRRASAIITVSQASRKNIIEVLGANPNQVFVTHEAASQAFQPINDSKLIDEMRSNFELNSKYILALGSADPRKNIKTLIEAYGLLEKKLQEDYHLVIVWTHPFLANEISKLVHDLGLTNNVHFLQHISNEDLVLIYNDASLFVFPSTYEGFGLPLLEAMMSGTPVVAADNSSIPEVVGDAAFMFNSSDIIELTRLMSVILNDPNLQNEMKKRGLERAKNFSWNKCALATIDVYKNALSAMETR
jgi:glycosyltransferase involved in cell wall biosynthesis